MKRISVVILCDVPALREGVRVFLEKPGDIETLGEVCSAEGLAVEVARQEPDVAIVAMGDRRRSLAAMGEIAHSLSGTAVIAVLAQSEEPPVADFVQAGARGVVSWTTSGEELAHIVRIVATGKLVVDPDERDGTRRDSRVAGHRHSIADARDFLTEREMEVLSLAAAGGRNRELAARLGLSEYTIKSHLANIFSKLGCRSRTEAVMIGIDNGWFPSPAGSSHGQARVPALLKPENTRKSESLRSRVGNRVELRSAFGRYSDATISPIRQLNMSSEPRDGTNRPPSVIQVWLGGPGRLFPIPVDSHLYLEMAGDS